MALFCLQSWKAQQRDLQDRATAELRAVELDSAKLNNDYKEQLRNFEGQQQHHITEKTSERTRIRDKYEARKRDIKAESSMIRKRRRLLEGLTPVEAFDLGFESGVLSNSAESRLTQEDEHIDREMNDIHEIYQLRVKATEDAMQKLKEQHAQERTTLEQRLNIIRDEALELRKQSPGQFRFIVGESVRLLDLSVQDLSAGLSSLRDGQQ